MRKLASIQQISHIEPIPKVDAIERARVLGWWLVIKKGEFAVGDKVVYCEVDSLLPERPEFEFLRPSCFKPAILDGEAVVQPAGFRIRTVKMRGQVSQGICFPLSILPADAPTEIDSDVTEALGIHKWEPPLPVGMSGRVKGHFPGFLSKTDETRIQILERVLERHRGRTFYVTEKAEGTSFSAFLREDEKKTKRRRKEDEAAKPADSTEKPAEGKPAEEKPAEKPDEAPAAIEPTTEEPAEPAESAPAKQD